MITWHDSFRKSTQTRFVGIIIGNRCIIVIIIVVVIIDIIILRGIHYNSHTFQDTVDIFFGNDVIGGSKESRVGGI